MGAAPAAPSSSRRYSFGEFTLDLERGALLRAGVHVDLRPKAFEVLRLLVERHGRLVTKQELLDAVWGRVVVTEGSVAKCLIEIRRAIDDAAQTAIKTVPRRGYIFDEPVTVHDGAVRAPIPTEAVAAARPRAGSTTRRWIFGAALALAVTITASWVAVTLRGAPQSASAMSEMRGASVAVLPFVDMSAERESEYLADGIAEEILNLLAQVPAVTVIARSSSFSFKGQNADIATIAETLHVTHVLEGSLRKSGNQVRITARFVDAATSAELWTATYDRELDDLFAVQSEIAGAVAGALRGTLDGSSRLATGAAASNLDLYQVNSTFYDALARVDRDYLLARAVQFFAPGVPQVYYVGLLAGHGDVALLRRTGIGRDINRHYYTRDELDAALQRPVVRNLCALIRLRNTHPAFGGEFSSDVPGGTELVMRWRNGADFAELRIDFASRRYSLVMTEAGVARSLDLSAPVEGAPRHRWQRGVP